MNLNDEQSKLLESLIDFISQQIIKFFLIDAKGGTGKTFTLKSFRDYMKGKKMKYNFLTPTNKAKKVLEQTGVSCQTIHKFFRYSVSYTEDGKEVYELKIPDILPEVIIIDECSMIDKKLLSYIYSLKEKCHIIFCGDRKQLPPVGEVESDVYKIKFYKTMSLTQNMRADNLKLNSIIDIYRNTSNGVNYKEISFCCFSRKDFLKKIIESFKKGEDSVVLAYSNSQVASYNNTIRAKIFNIDETELEDYYPGETIVFTDYVKIFDPCEKRIVYENKLLEILHDDGDDEKKRYNCYYTSSNATIESIIVIDMKIELFFKKTLEYKCFKIKLENGDIIYKPYDNRELGIFKKYFSNYHRYIKNYPKNKKELWKRYYEYKKILNAPIEYVYSMTIHKSQGSGWDNVFLDEKNVYLCLSKCASTRKKALYTAVSRAKKNVYIAPN